MPSSILYKLTAALLFAAACYSAQSRPSSASESAEVTQSADTMGIVLAAGDIATCSYGARETADILDTLAGEILVVGDAAYSSGRDPNPYRTCYDSTWGRYKNRTHPVPGNHDMETQWMYFGYFGSAAGPSPGGYYSFAVGPWHILALNSNIDMRPGSRQGRWAAADLAAHPAQCTLAFMHHPHFSSGPHTKSSMVAWMWRLLDSAGVDVVISGHDHIYERFAPMHEDGSPDDRSGVRQFVVGTGGAPRYKIENVAAHSEARSVDAHGVLKLTLLPGRYTWEFIPAARADFHDAGSGTCH